MVKHEKVCDFLHLLNDFMNKYYTEFDEYCQITSVLKKDCTNNVWMYFFPNNFTNFGFYYFTFFPV